MSAIFSLIIPYHNTEAHDRREMMWALEASIPDRADLEVIWVDDDSTLPWQPKGDHAQTVHRFLSAQDGQRYAGAARNTGLDHAIGEWLFFADSDDLLVPEAIESVFETALKIGNEVDLLLFQVAGFRDDGRPATRHHYLDAIHTELDRTGNTDRMIDYHSCFGKLLRRGMIDRHALRFAPVRYGNDVLFSVRLAISSPRWVKSNAVGYLLREGHASLTNTVSRDAVIARFERAREIYDLLHASDRLHLAAPQRHLIRKYGLRAPLTVCAQVFLSLVRGYPVFRAPIRDARKH